MAITEKDKKKLEKGHRSVIAFFSGQNCSYLRLSNCLSLFPKLCLISHAMASGVPLFINFPWPKRKPWLASLPVSSHREVEICFHPGIQIQIIVR
jgi:hypothetical protein